MRVKLPEILKGVRKVSTNKSFQVLLCRSWSVIKFTGRPLKYLSLK